MNDLQHMNETQNPHTCRWLDRYFGNVCRNEQTHPSERRTEKDKTVTLMDGRTIAIPAGTVFFCEPECRPCEGCGYEPITPTTPAWDDPGEEYTE